MLYEHVTWDGIIKKKFRTKHCIIVDLILKHNQRGLEVGKGQIHYIFN